jgi:cephalosporin hydroxylase
MDKLILENITHHVLTDVTYCGIPTRKNPLDAWIYQELIWKVKPTAIVELGTFMGGSALMFLHMLLWTTTTPTVVTVDINACEHYHTGIVYLQGKATDAGIVRDAHLLTFSQRVMVVEDSTHEYQNTLDVLRLYNDLVPVDSYFIVEDTVCHHGLDVGPYPGPYEAVQQFLAENDKFKPDLSCEKFGLTYNPSGFLKRVK